MSDLYAKFKSLQTYFPYLSRKLSPLTYCQISKMDVSQEKIKHLQVFRDKQAHISKHYFTKMDKNQTKAFLTWVSWKHIYNDSYCQQLNAQLPHISMKTPQLTFLAKTKNKYVYVYSV